MNCAFKTRNCAFKTRNCALKTRNCALKTWNCAFKTRNCALKTRNCAFKTRNCAFKTWNCAFKTRNVIFKNDGFCRPLGRRMRVTALECKDLPKMGRVGQNDVFLAVHVDGEVLQTSVVSGGGACPRCVFVFKND